MSTPERLLCPTSGEVCTYKVQLSRYYAPINGVGQEHVPPEFNSLTDSIKCAARFAELDAAARVLGCEGPNDDFSCPTAETMANSRTRRASRTVVKKVISLFRGTK